MYQPKFFKSSEFKKCIPSCSIEAMDSQFLRELDECRNIAGVPFRLMSAYRSPEYDKSKGRSGTGFHTSGRAVDVSCINGEDRRAIIEGALAVGLTVGVYPSFIHLDNRRKPIIFVSK